MSGSGYVMGMAIASYEWMAALTLIVVGKWILPVFLKNGIYTMPEFLERRYSPAVRNVMAVFWLALYIFVNLTSILWLGALAVNAITGLDLQIAITALGAVRAAVRAVRRTEGRRAHRHRAGVAAGRWAASSSRGSRSTRSAAAPA